MAEFEAAYAARPHFSVLYNIGQTRSTLGRPVQALAAFERYLADGSAQIVEPRRSEVEALILACRGRIGQLHVLTDGVADARVWVDGHQLETAQISAPFPLAVGDHSLIYSSGTEAPVERAVSIEPGQTVELRIEPAPTKPKAPALPARSFVRAAPADKHTARLGPAPMTREREHPSSSRHKVSAAILSGVGVVLLATAAGVYAWNSGRYDDWLVKGQNPRQIASLQRADDASLGLVILGGGLTLGGAALFVWTN